MIFSFTTNTDKKGKSGVNFFGFSISFAEYILISSRTGVTP